MQQHSKLYKDDIFLLAICVLLSDISLKSFLFFL